MQGYPFPPANSDRIINKLSVLKKTTMPWPWPCFESRLLNPEPRVITSLLPTHSLEVRDTFLVNVSWPWTIYFCCPHYMMFCSIKYWQYLWERSLTTSFHCGIWTARSASVRHNCWEESAWHSELLLSGSLTVFICQAIGTTANQNTAKSWLPYSTVLQTRPSHYGLIDCLPLNFSIVWFKIIMQCSLW